MEHQITLTVGIVMAGQILTRADGTQIVCPDDLVQVRQDADGQFIGSMEFTPEQALGFAETVRGAAVQAINTEIDDSGKPTNLLHRLSRVLGEGPRS